jgi:hypothetical protein
MKKMIAISVVFILLSTVAFAQAAVGGNLKMSTTMIGGQSANPLDDNFPQAGSVKIWDSHVNVNFGDGDAGGMVRLWSIPGGGSPIDWTPSAFTFWWWKPIPQLRIQLGQNADGDWGHAQITGWSFNAEAQGGIVVDQHRGLNGDGAVVVARTAAWAPGFNSLGLTLSAYPVQGLTVNLAIPFDSAKTWAEIYSRMYADVVYQIPDIGTARLAAQIAPGGKKKYEPSDDVENGLAPAEAGWRGAGEARESMKMHAAFFLSAIEGLGAELGLAYQFPITTTALADGGEGAAGLPAGARKIYPVEVGLGARYAINPDFNIKLRAGTTFGGGAYLLDPVTNQKAYKEQADDLKNPNMSQYFLTSNETFTLVDGEIVSIPRGWQSYQKDNMKWGVNILPSYKIGPMVVFLNAGIGMTHYAKQTITYFQDASILVDENGDAVLDGSGAQQEDPDKPARNVTVEVQGKIIANNTVYSNPYNFYGTYTAGDMDLKVVKYDVEWYVNPYIRIGTGAGSFYAGFKLYADGTRIPAKWDYSPAVNSYSKDKDLGGLKPGDDVKAGDFGALSSSKYQIKWEIPIGWNVYF